MDIVLLILQLIVLAAIAVLGVLARSYLPSYAKAKGKNLATKEDISEITKKVEEVRSHHSSELERLKVNLGVLARKHDILLDEKVRVFKELQKQLVSFKRYCEGALGEFSASEFHPRLESLPDEIEKSTLMHLTALHYLEQDNYIFLSDRARNILKSLHGQMSLMCSMELAMFGNDVGNEDREEIMGGVPDAYKSAMKSVDECLVELYNDLQMPDSLQAADNQSIKADEK